jgi:hypothetical protein
VNDYCCLTPNEQICVLHVCYMCVHKVQFYIKTTHINIGKIMRNRKKYFLLFFLPRFIQKKTFRPIQIR